MTGKEILPPLVVIIGPTAVGKTEIAIELAKRLNGEIVSADSRYLYRGMDIGTAKPSPLEQQDVPHHLIDVADPDEPWSMALFQKIAFETIAAVHAREHIPFLVGGTGQYIRAITSGWAPPPVEPDPRMREALENWAQVIGKQELHAKLTLLDPQAGNFIDYRNLRRTIRALEVIFTTGKRFSEQRSSVSTRFRIKQIGLTRPRSELYERVDQRIDQMIKTGFVDEVHQLLEEGYHPDLTTFSAIGYREIAAFLQGQLTLDEAAAQMKRTTRQFVRRQANWFKSDDPHIEWFTVNPGTIHEIESTLRDWLGQ